MALELVEVEAPTLDELAEIANREHRLAVEAAESSLEHAIRSGEALSSVKAQMNDDRWAKWVASNFISTKATANRYVRLALYKDSIPEWATGYQSALDYLRGLPYVSSRTVYPPELHEEAKRLSDAGKTRREIAATLGVSHPTVTAWLNPDAKRKWDRRYQTRRKRAHAALRREETAKAAKRRGGDAHLVWSYAAKLAQALGRACEGASSTEERIHLENALRRLHIVEDDISKALRS